MKLYGAHLAANPRRVKIYIAEKGLTGIEQVEFLAPHDEIRSPAFLARNPAGRIPVLELDDGTWLPESDAIIEYLEELNPEPTMMGRTPLERAWVRAFNRMAQDLFIQIRLYLPHILPDRFPHIRNPIDPQVGHDLQTTIDRGLNNIDIRIGENSFLTNSVRPMTSDCHLYALLSASERFGWKIPEKLERLAGWYRRFGERPSVTA